MKKPIKPVKPKKPEEPSQVISHDFRIFGEELVEEKICPPYHWDDSGHGWKEEDFDNFYEKYGFEDGGCEVGINLKEVLDLCVRKGCKDVSTIFITAFDNSYRGSSDADVVINIGFLEHKDPEICVREAEEYSFKLEEYEKNCALHKENLRKYKEDSKIYRLWRKKTKLKAELAALEMDDHQAMLAYELLERS
jgi:hypothetical protein